MHHAVAIGQRFPAINARRTSDAAMSTSNEEAAAGAEVSIKQERLLLVALRTERALYTRSKRCRPQAAADGGGDMAVTEVEEAEDGEDMRDFESDLLDHDDDIDDIDDDVEELGEGNIDEDEDAATQPPPSAIARVTAGAAGLVSALGSLASRVGVGFGGWMGA